MTNYAELNEQNIVINVIVADAEFVAQSQLHYVLLSQGGIGYTYDADADQFVAPQPYESWTWANNIWNAPTPMPTDGELYHWNETTQEWIQL